MHFIYLFSFQDAFDPAFILPFLQRVANDPELDVRRFVEIGALSLAVMGFCLEDDALRQVAFNIVATVVALIEVQYLSNLY